LHCTVPGDVNYRKVTFLRIGLLIKTLRLPYTKSCACNMHVTCIIQVVTCINLGTCHVHVPFISTCM
jgi:hypothetical protein